MIDRKNAFKNAILENLNKKNENVEVVLANADNDVIIYKKTNDEGQPVYQGCIRNFDLVRNGHQQMMRMRIENKDLEKLKESLAETIACDYIKFEDRGGMVL